MGTLNAAAYLAMLQSKITMHRDDGVRIARSDINPMLKPHQLDIVEWACRKGRAAIFAAFGLGKSFMQLEIARLLLANAPNAKRALVIVPLGVRHEFRLDAEKLGIKVAFVRKTDEVAGDGIYLTNYESMRDGKLDPDLFQIVTLDEASVLRSYGSKTYQQFLTLLARVPYRFVATATPSPNSYKELIHYAGFLGVMDTGQALTRFFQRDSEQANNLTVYTHMEGEFHAWLHSWSAFVQKPSDMGYDDAGYDMPELDVRVHEVQALDLQGTADRDGQGRLIRDSALGLKDAATEKRTSIPARVAKMMEIIAESPDDHFILWHDLEAERHAIKSALPEASEVYGSLDMDERERRVIAFAEGELKYLATKPEISGSGCNFQRHCHRAIFLGIGYKFNDLIQAIHRICRFLQPHQCRIDIIMCETEREIWRTLQRKWNEHNTLTDRMSALIAQHGLSSMSVAQDLARTIGVTRTEESGKGWMVANNDTVLECDMMETNSVGMILTSIPFGNHYEYSASYNDFGHNDDNVRFFEQMDHLSPNLLRILKPGRVMAVHTKDRIRFGNVTGYGMPSVEPFHADCIAHYRKHGFIYCGMITVVTDVVRENNQTYRLGWTENSKDSSKMGVGCPEYVLLFRKLPTDQSRAYADEPVKKDKKEYTRGQWQIDAHSFWRSSGNRFLTADEFDGLGPDVLAGAFARMSAEQIYDYKQHVDVANALDAKGRLPSTFMSVAPGSHDPDVWHDVLRMKTLNAEQSQRNLSQHICPFQIDIVERLIGRYTSKEDIVFDPFGGLGTVPNMAIKMGRKGRAVELNAEYYRDAVRGMKLVERECSMPSLFDMLSVEAAE
jgi:DNA modification methylase